MLDASTLDAAQPLAEQWGYTPDEFEMLTRFSDGCSVIASVDDEAVGMTFGFPWSEVGWIGGVLTLEAHRGQGIGQAMVEASVDALQARGCETVKLYATPKAIGLYERIGFTGEAEYLILGGSHRRGRDPDVVDLEGRMDEVARLDRAVFPGDRTGLLEELAKRHPETAIGVTDEHGDLAGYGLARPGPETTEIGPVVVADGDANRAQALVDGLLTRVEGTVELIHPKGSWAASSTWSCRGFVTVDTPLEMRLGPPVEEDRDAIVAAGGQEVG